MIKKGEKMMIMMMMIVNVSLKPKKGRQLWKRNERRVCEQEEGDRVRGIGVGSIDK